MGFGINNALILLIGTNFQSERTNAQAINADRLMVKED